MRDKQTGLTLDQTQALHLEYVAIFDIVNRLSRDNPQIRLEQLERALTSRHERILDIQRDLIKAKVKRIGGKS